MDNSAPPGDLMAQTDMVACEVRLTVEGACAGTDAIAKLVVFYVGDGIGPCPAPKMR